MIEACLFKINAGAMFLKEHHNPTHLTDQTGTKPPDKQGCLVSGPPMDRLIGANKRSYNILMGIKNINEEAPPALLVSNTTHSCWGRYRCHNPKENLVG